MNNHRQIGRTFEGGYSQALDFDGQLGQSLGNPVLDLNLRLIEVGSQLEGNRQRHDPVGGRLGRHVKTVLDTRDDLLKR